MLVDFMMLEKVVTKEKVATGEMEVKTADKIWGWCWRGDELCGLAGDNGGGAAVVMVVGAVRLVVMMAKMVVMIKEEAMLLIGCGKSDGSGDGSGDWNGDDERRGDAGDNNHDNNDHDNNEGIDRKGSKELK
jgi:hypothetical protein